MSSLFKALFTGTSKHKKLSEEWATLREPVVEGVTFHCKYLGSTLVDDPKGEAATAEAIKRVIHSAKLVARKPERVALHVSLKGIRMEDTMTRELLLQTSIYKISYCSADAHYDHVFAFIATTDNDTCACHAFLCPKRKMAQAVTISIAQAFNLAYECWKMSIDNKDETFGHEELPAEVTVGTAALHSLGRVSQSQPSSQASSPIPIRSDFGSSELSTSGYQSSSQALLIDLEDSSEHPGTTSHPHAKTSAQGKPRNTLDDLEDISDGFSRLALRRENPPRALSGTSRQGLAELGLPAFTAPQAASPTESGLWPSTSPPKTHTPLATSPQTTSPLATSPPDPWLSQSPPDNWGIYSKSPNSAFLHSCQSPPSSNMFPSTVQSFNQSVQLPNTLQSSICTLQSLPYPPQSTHSTQLLANPPQSAICTLQSLPFPPQSFQSLPNHPQSCPQSPTNPFPTHNFPNDPFSPIEVKISHTISQEPTSISTPVSDNPFLQPTNPFTPTPVVVKEGVSGSPRVMVSPKGGCSPGRPVWTDSGAKSKNVICS